MLALQAPESVKARRAFYQEHGYLIFPQLLGPAEVAALRAALAEVLRRAEGLSKTTDVFSIVPGDNDGRPYVRRIFNPIAHHPTFRELVFHPKIVEIVASLIGPNVQLRNTKLNLKPPSRKAAFEWHQDYPFGPHTNFDLVAVMVNFDDATVENGCLTIVPGSHRLGPVSHEFGGQGGTNSPIRDLGLLGDPARWIDVEVPAGSVELHHCNLLHSSGANRSSRPRSAMITNYRAADNFELGGDPGYPGSGWGTMVCGAPTDLVRMERATFELKGALRGPRTGPGGPG